jgi:hypothetical protein
MTQVQGEAANLNPVSGSNGAGDAVSLWRLYVLRALYVGLAAGEGLIQLSAFLHHAHWTQTSGVGRFWALLLPQAVLSFQHGARIDRPYGECRPR